MRRNILLTMVPLLLCAGPILAADTVLWSENFNSYDTGYAPPAPWADWTSGTAPAPTTIVDGGNTDNCMQMSPSGGTPIDWFTNGFDVNNRIVTVTWYVRGDVGGQNWSANYPSSLSTTWGSLQGSYGTARPGSGGSLGGVSVNGDWTSQATNLTPVRYGGVWYYSPVLKDGVTWNKFELTAIARNVTAGGISGEATLTISYTDPNDSVFHTFSTSSSIFNLSGIGLTGLRASGTNAGDGTQTWYIDDISVVQKETLAPPPEGLPLPEPDKGYYPNAKGLQGGIITDGSQYIYMTSGSGTNGQIIRYDVATGTFGPNPLTNRPTTWSTTDPNGIVTNHNDQHESHGLGFINGKIVDFAGDRFDTGCDAYVYDVDANTWTRTLARNVNSYELTFAQASVGKYQVGTTTVGQGGTVIYDTSTDTFIGGQVLGASPAPPGGWQWGTSIAAAPSADPNNSADTFYIIGANNSVTGKGSLIRGDVGRWAADPNLLTPLYDPEGTLADLPVAVDTGGTAENGLCYVTPKFSALYIIHQIWGQAGLYEVRIQGGGLFAVLNGSNAIYKYDIASNTWATLAQVLPFEFGGGDDMTSSLLLTGDTNADGVVDVNDLNNVYNNLGTAGPMGDTNGDGVVDVIDLNNVYNWLGTTNDWYGAAGAAEIPEPATMVLLAIGGLVALRRKQ